MKPGYKQTEVGVIPEDWEVKRLGKIAQLKNGYAFKSATYDPLGNFKIITIANVQDGFMDASECSHINSLPADLQPHQQLEIGDILISMTGNVGRVCRVIEENCLLNQRVGKLVPKDFDSNLLFLILGQRRFICSMANKAKGGAQGNLSVSDITEFEFPAPSSEPEQRAIAEALSDVDGLLGWLDRLIAKKRDLKQAAMQQLLTGQTRLPGFHGEWEVKRLGDIADFANGKPHEGHIDAAGQFYLVTLDSIGIDGKLKAEHKPIGVLDDSLQKDDIVTILSDIAHGNLLGLCDVIPENNRYVLNQRVGRLRVKPDTQTNTQFLRLQINRRQHHFKTRGQGTSQRHVYRRDFDQLELSLPTPAEQTAIAEILSDMDAELTALEQRREKVRALKQAMMQELLTGRTRLV